MNKPDYRFCLRLIALLLFVAPCCSVSADNSSETRRISIGFENLLIEMKVPTPMLATSESRWVSSSTPEIAEALAAPAPEPARWVKNQFRPDEMPAIPGQKDNISQQRQFPEPFLETVSRRQAATDFLTRRPDIADFVRDNLGETDPIKVLEHWVYEIMRSEDSDWEEAKKILEELD
ncbi:MAG: hypothetical protein CVV42_03210 [Candidatus Riflebacteria bacterium HGW-Riflebacteria-2]|nr:MAG: hypothetical protein CVV42_03210 [Candidatus Riflebacteria bacterium HGW-Riflebacteria-2]